MLRRPRRAIWVVILEQRRCRGAYTHALFVSCIRLYTLFPLFLLLCVPFWASSTNGVSLAQPHPRGPSSGAHRPWLSPTPAVPLPVPIAHGSAPPPRSLFRCPSPMAQPHPLRSLFRCPSPMAQPHPRGPFSGAHRPWLSPTPAVPFPVPIAHGSAPPPRSLFRRLFSVRWLRAPGFRT